MTVKAMKESGGRCARPGTGRCSIVQASPAASVATAVQNCRAAVVVLEPDLPLPWLGGQHPADDLVADAPATQRPHDEEVADMVAPLIVGVRHDEAAQPTADPDQPGAQRRVGSRPEDVQATVVEGPVVVGQMCQSLGKVVPVELTEVLQDRAGTTVDLDELDRCRRGRRRTRRGAFGRRPGGWRGHRASITTGPGPPWGDPGPVKESVRHTEVVCRRAQCLLGALSCR